MFSEPITQLLDQWDYKTGYLPMSISKPITQLLDQYDTKSSYLLMSTFDPFGEIDYAKGISDNDNLFTGKERDEESGLDYFGARYYNPVIGRWINKDDLRGKITRPQSLNRYLYCYNNPFQYIDFFGREPVNLKVYVERQGAGDKKQLMGAMYAEGWKGGRAERAMIFWAYINMGRNQNKNLENLLLKSGASAAVRDKNERYKYFIGEMTDAMKKTYKSKWGQKYIQGVIDETKQELKSYFKGILNNTLDDPLNGADHFGSWNDVYNSAINPDTGKPFNEYFDKQIKAGKFVPVKLKGGIGKDENAIGIDEKSATYFFKEVKND